MYHLYKAVFFLALFPKAVFNISNVFCLDFLFATQNLIANRCSRDVILLIRIICVTRFCSASNDVKIGTVTSLVSTSNQGCCLNITQYRKWLSHSFCLNTEFLVKTDENVNWRHVRRVASSCVAKVTNPLKQCVPRVLKLAFNIQNKSKIRFHKYQRDCFFSKNYIALFRVFLDHPSYK